MKRRTGQPITAEDKAFYDSFVRIGPEIKHYSIPMADFARQMGIDTEKWNVFSVHDVRADGERRIIITVKAKAGN